MNDAHAIDFQAMFDSGIGAFALIDADGVVLRSNTAFMNLLGDDRRSLVGARLTMFIHPDDAAMLETALRHVSGGAGVDDVIARLSGEGAEWREWRLAPCGGAILCALRDISQRMSALKGETLFRRAFETSSEPAVIADARARDHPIIFANDAFLRLTGYDRDEVVGKNCRFLQGEEEGQDEAKAIGAAIRAGEPARATLRNYRKNGELFLNQLVVSPLRDDDGRLIYFIGQQRDVTEVAQTQQKLKESVQLYRQLVETPNIIAWRFDLESKCFTYVSPQAEQMLGYPIPDWYEPGFWESRLHPRDARVVAALRRNRIKQREAHSTEYRMIRADGSEIWMRDVMNAATWAEDAPRVIDGFMLDVTDRVEARQRAEQNEAYLNAILDTAPDAILTVDGDLTIKSFNRAAEAMFGWPASEILGESLSMLVPFGDEGGGDKRGAHEILARAYVDDPMAAAKLMGDWRRIKGLRRDGEEFPVMISLNRTVVDEKVSVTAIARDMTAIEKANRDLANLSNELAEQLILANEANVAKTQFLAAMSHELRTPLNAVIGFADIMAQEMFGRLGDERYRLYANDILASGQHLLELINDVLDLSRIEAGRANLRPEPTPVRLAVADALRLVRPMVSQAGLSLRAAIGRSLPDMSADRRALNQILLNLLSNAVKFTGRGGRIVLRGERQQDGFIRISVEDTGVGIPSDKIHRLGQPFEQVGDIYRAETKGTGLGLAITRSLAEAMGGKMIISSEIGVGTTVAVTVPIVGAAAAEIAAGR